ncbi:MAG: PQQ-dependent sugar dehydrogenase, partial [Bacteroidetes bacterium]|nr:PQQ-dependent sugar dehydrogenase [Bacteroidota bacterium]
MKRLLTVLASLYLLNNSLSAQTIQLNVFASGFVRPVDITNCGDDRLFIVSQTGYIWIVDENGIKLPNPFLNIDAIVGSSGNEQGLLGLAFHPNYAQNGYFYVNYTNNNGDTRISRFSVSGDPNIADPNSELLLLEVDQPYSNHNGGCLKFGFDGYLYIGLGDGGSGGDPQGNGQKRTTFLGKMHRIDVDNGTPYGIPPTNPFVGDPNTLDEIWALGLRNPWRFSFDRLTGDLWIGDVGQDSWEEVDHQPAASTGGENYGWSCYEGNHVYNTGNCPPMSELTFPVAEYANSGSLGCSVTGGFVYRGFNYPQLYGRYLYTDYCTGRLWSITPDGAGGWTNVQLADLLNNQLVSFGENKNGELFAAGLGSNNQPNGNIYRVTETTETWGYDVTVDGIACEGESNGSIIITFGPNTPPATVLWNDGAIGPVRTNLPAGTYIATIIGANASIVTETFVFASTVSLSAAVTNVTCPGAADGSIDLTLNGSVEPSTAGWSDGSSDFDRTGLSGGNYTVTVTSNEGCVFVETFEV